MIKTLSYLTLKEFNKTKLDNLFLYATLIVPSFIAMTLFSLWIILIFGSYFSSKRLTGKGDFAGLLAASSFIVTIVAFGFNLVGGLVNLEIMVICFSITIVSLIFLMFSRREN